MSGCERGRRTRCERGTEIHPVLPTEPPHHHPHQHQQHQPAPTEPPARGPAPPPARTTSTMANSSSTTSSTGTNNASTMTTPAQPSAPTQRPAQPAPASLAAVPPPAPAPHAGICSAHVSMYAQDSKIYSYILQNKKCWHAGSWIFTCLQCLQLFDTQHTNKHAYTSILRECKH